MIYHIKVKEIVRVQGQNVHKNLEKDLIKVITEENNVFHFYSGTYIYSRLEKCKIEDRFFAVYHKPDVIGHLTVEIYHGHVCGQDTVADSTMNLQ